METFQFDRRIRFLAPLVLVLALGILASCDDPLPPDVSHISTLANLLVPEGQLRPTFSPAVFEYSVELPAEVATFTLVPATVKGQTFSIDPNDTNVTPGIHERTLVVAAADGTTSRYHFRILRHTLDPADATLFDLAPATGPGVGALTPAFAPAVLSYTLAVTNTVHSLSFTPLLANLGAVVTPPASSSLVVGDNVLTYTVVSKDGTGTQTYSVTVTRLSVPSTLSSLVPSQGTLDQSFAPGTHAYQVAVPNPVSTFSLSASPTDPAATVTPDGPASLVVGANTFHETVTATDGTQTVYTVTVNRDLVHAQVSSLAALSIGTVLSPPFSPGVTTYKAVVPSATASLTVLATATDPRSSVAGMGVDTPVAWPHTVAVTVTAADGIAQTVYSVAVTRATTLTPKSVDSSLKSLVVGDDENGGTLVLNPPFSPAKTDYAISTTTPAVNLPAPASGGIGAVANDPGASVAVGPTADPLAIPVGTTTITVTVTAADGSKTKYFVHIIRSQGAKSNVSTLKSLVLSLGNLDQPFAPGTSLYTATLPTGALDLKVTATPTDAKAKVATGTAGAPVTLDFANLQPGANTCNIPVTAADGTQTLYTVSAFVPLALSNDAGLTSLTVPGSTAFTPAFTSATKAYTVTVPAKTTSVAPVWTTSALGAQVSVAGAAGLATGNNPVTVTVTAPDGTTQSVYTLTVVVPKSSDASLSTLGITTTSGPGTLSPVFAPATLAYTALVPAGTTSVTVGALAHDAAAQGVAGTGPQAVSAASDTALTITVTAQDGTTKKYTVTVRTTDRDASLASLSLAGVALSPSFSPAVAAYTASVPNATTSITVSASATQGTASVAIVGNTGLAVGANSVTITVTAPDGTTKAVYSVTVTRASAGLTGTLTGSATYAGSDHAAFWIWVTNALGAYVETLVDYRGTSAPPSTGTSSDWANSRGTAALGVDAISAATWTPSATKSFVWSFKDSTGASVPPGAYTFHIAVHEQNGTTSKLYTATVDLGPAALTQNFTPLDSVVSKASVVYTP